MGSRARGGGRNLKGWCVANIILPGLALMDGNNTTEPPVTCHLPARTPDPENPVMAFFGDNWFWVLILTLAVLAVVGLVLGLHHMRARAVLRRQLDRGLISREDYERLR